MNVQNFGSPCTIGHQKAARVLQEATKRFRQGGGLAIVEKLLVEKELE